MAAANKPKQIAADGFLVTQQLYAPTYTASGNLMANENLDIHPELSGRVTGIYFKEGTAVHKGQLLLKMNDADIKAQITKLRSQRSLQQLTATRQIALLKIGGIAQQDYDATKTGIQGIDADIALNEATLAKMEILAPFDGIIGLRNISPGAIVSPTTIVASLQQLSPLKMDFTIPDEYRQQISLGQTVRFFVDGSQDTLSGKIAAIEPGADPTTRTVKIRALVPNADGKLLPGAFAHVMVSFGAQNTSILIPSQSIIPTTRDKKVALLKDGKIVMQVVQVGDRTPDRIQITSGLKQGDTILTTALMQVKQGMQVKIRKLIH